MGKGSSKSSASLKPENDQSEKFRTSVAPEDKGYGELRASPAVKCHSSIGQFFDC